MVVLNDSLRAVTVTFPDKYCVKFLFIYLFFFKVWHVYDPVFFCSELTVNNNTGQKGFISIFYYNPLVL